MTTRYLPATLAGTAAIAAALLLGFDLTIGIDADDTENLEATRVLATARQITEGFGSLYGPYSGANPYVLIQAPLYYRLTAVAALPMTALGVDPVAACRASGRILALGSFLGLLIATGSLARLDGAGRFAGRLAALLVASSPIVGSFPVTLRPDMTGVLLQTTGLLLVLAVLGGRSRRVGPALIGAYVCFGMALCTKQHYLIGPLFASVLLAASWRRDEISWRPIVGAHAAAVGLVVAYLGLEEWWTAGAMSRAVFVLPGELRAVTAGSWPYVVTVFVETIKRSAGLIALAFAVDLCGRRVWQRLDVQLAIFAILDLLWMAKLCRDSSGGWFNYAIQSAVILAVLTARAADRIAWTALTRPRLAVIAGAALALVAVDARLVAKGVAFRREVREGYRQILADPRVAGVPAGARYFPGVLQHYNVRAGRGELAHDEWLYRAFEAIDAAEPRERWLRSALEDGPIRVVVAEAAGGPPDGGFRVAGVAQPIAALGFEPAGRNGRYAIYIKR